MQKFDKNIFLLIKYYSDIHKSIYHNKNFEIALFYMAFY